MTFKKICSSNTALLSNKRRERENGIIIIIITLQWKSGAKETGYKPFMLNVLKFLSPFRSDHHCISNHTLSTGTLWCHLMTLIQDAVRFMHLVPWLSINTYYFTVVCCYHLNPLKPTELQYHPLLDTTTQYNSLCSTTAKLLVT